MIVTRFAPSPTGYLHIGGARTALFNWLLAKKTGGKFILRIEDTDQVRSTDESTRKILEDMKWLGLDWTEGPEVGGPAGPYFQSQRLEIYRKYVETLLNERRAYKCFETPEELDAARKIARDQNKNYRYDRTGFNLSEEQIKQFESENRPYVIRFRMPDTDIVVSDTILGEITFKAAELEDFVIMKSDGFPTYHLAVVVDDQLMGVTHILRGQEHLMNTPKHQALQDALGFSRPTYAHMPLIFNMDGSKMSKRDKEKAIKANKPVPEIDVHDFRIAGYLPEALLNFVALLGWSPGGDRELMSISEMTELFSVERIGKTNAKFDRDKLRSFNTEYIKNMDDEKLKFRLKQFLDITDYPLKNVNDEQLDAILKLYKPRSRTLKELAENSKFLFVSSGEVQYDPKAVSKIFHQQNATDFLQKAQTTLKEISPNNWTADNLEKTFENLCSSNSIKISDMAQILRVAVSGCMVSPPIFQTLEFLQKDQTEERISHAFKYIKVDL